MKAKRELTSSPPMGESEPVPMPEERQAVPLFHRLLEDRCRFIPRINALVYKRWPLFNGYIMMTPTDSPCSRWLFRKVDANFGEITTCFINGNDTFWYRALGWGY
jgi:hypothetical protein